jgi:hypothetical protein
MNRFLPESRQSFFLWALVVLLWFINTGCGTSIIRSAVPEDLHLAAHIPGIEDARQWGDIPPVDQDDFFDLDQELLKKRYSHLVGKQPHFLAISGGGADGAFGAGFLTGWSQNGTRPEFFIVTGISAGALIAPFAFLGSEYDDRLEAIWTQYATKDILKRRSFLNYIFKDAVASSRPLKELLKQHLPHELIDKIADEYIATQRQLLVGTTNLDAMRPVIWNIGAIAASNYPEKYRLVYDVLVASASIPGAFPPVYIKVAPGNGKYDEIHVDGGTASQVFVYPPKVDWQQIEKVLEFPHPPILYVIRNAKLYPEWDAVNPRIDGIAVRSIASLIRTQGLGDLHRIFLKSREEGMDFNLVFIGNDFSAESRELFDPSYMKKLFQYGYTKGIGKDEVWKKAPPMDIQETF